MRIAIIINVDLPIGLAANAAAILGMSVGRAAPECVGPDISDAAGGLHPGITNRPVPVLGAAAETIATLRERAAAEPDVRFTDFSDIAQRTATYPEYTERLARTDPGDLRYFGLCLYGRDETVRRLTAGLPLLGR